MRNGDISVNVHNNSPNTNTQPPYLQQILGALWHKNKHGSGRYAGDSTKSHEHPPAVKGEVSRLKTQILSRDNDPRQTWAENTAQHGEH